MSTESQVSARWLYETLNGDATLSSLAPGGVWDEQAPEDTDYPLVTFAWQGEADVYVVGAARVMSSQAWLVKAVADSASFEDLADVTGRLDALLHDTFGTTTGGEVFASTRERGLRQDENANGVAYRHLGGVYRLLTQAS